VKPRDSLGADASPRPRRCSGRDVVRPEPDDRVQTPRFGQYRSMSRYAPD
jgi:hypothetical protein